MKTHNRLFCACILSCGLFAVGATRLRADEPQAEAPKPPAPTTEVTVPIDISTVEAEWVPNVSEWVLQVAGQTDSLLGVNVKPVDDVLRSHLGLAEGKGLVVTGMAEGGALAHAGVRQNDVLLSVAVQEISSLEMLSKTLREAHDKASTIEIIRAGKKESIEIKPGALLIADIDLKVVEAQHEPRYRLGVGLAVADDTLRSQLSLFGGEGLVVTSIENDSPAAKSGVLVNDVLIKLDGKALTSIDALQEQLQQIGDKAVPLELMRRGQPATLTVTPEKLAPVAEQHFLAAFANPYQVNLNQAPLWVFATQPNAYQNLGYQNVPLNTNYQNTNYQNVTFPINAYDLAKPNAEAQVAAMLEQVRQLQASLEALQAALKTQPQPAEGSEKK